VIILNKFSGFTDHESFSRLPDSFFRELLAVIDSTEELKVTLYAMWRFENMEGRQRFLRESDFTPVLSKPNEALAPLAAAVERGTLLGTEHKGEVLYFLNSPRGRAAAKSLAQGTWEPGAVTSHPPVERPNVFRLYEENIGPLTPLVSDALKDAEQIYPPEWIAEAVGEAVLNNKRNWKYVEAILRRWKDEGHAKEQDRRDAEGLHGRDVTRKVEEFLRRKP
jgi:DNA replication protein